MEHEIIFQFLNEKDQKEANEVLADFNFQKIRPMDDMLNIHEDLYTSYGKPGMVCYIDDLVGGSYPVTKGKYEQTIMRFLKPDESCLIRTVEKTYSKPLTNVIVPNNGLINGETKMKYDKEVALARKVIRELPINGRDDRLHKYGYESDDVTYMLKGVPVTPKCQGDALLLGKILLTNMVQLGSCYKEEWVDKNWGSSKPLSVGCTYDDEEFKDFFDFETESTIFPLLNYISALLEEIQMRIEYTYGIGDSTVTMIKPYDSTRFTEM